MGYLCMKGEQLKDWDARTSEGGGIFDTWAK